jgi:hypothetical protein
MSRIVRTETRRRGFMGHVVKWIFILFNVLMAVWLVAGMAGVGEVADRAANDAERAGAAVGGAIGLGVLLFIWAAGSFILGLLTVLSRGRKTIIEERVG